MPKKKPGLYANIHAKRKRIKAGLVSVCVNLALRVRLLRKRLSSQLRQLRNERRSSAC